MPQASEKSRSDYILTLVRILEKRCIDGQVDEVLADRIERLMEEFWPTHRAGNDEYASWFPIAATGVLVGVDAGSPEGDRTVIGVAGVDLAALAAALRRQRQVDEDGTEVAVSRQAADEAATVIEGLVAIGVPVLGEGPG